MTTTFSTDVLDQLLDEERKLGYKFTGSTTSSAATVTSSDPELIKLGTSASADRFTNRYVWIPSAAAAADQIRTVTSFAVSSGGVASFTFSEDANFGEALSDKTMYVLFDHPTYFLNRTNDALDEIFAECAVPLRDGPASADMQGANVDTDWTETNATDAVQTTSSEVFQGAQSFVVTDSGSGGGYTVSAAQKLGQGRDIRVHAIVKADTGTSILQVKDASGNTQDSISVTQEDWTYLSKTVQFDSGEETFTIRLVESAASDEGDWQAAWYVKRDSTFFQLPTWIDASFKISDVVRREHHVSGGEDDTWLATAYEDIRLEEGKHYRYIHRGADANPTAILLTKEGQRFIDEPIFVLVSCPYSAPYGVSATLSGYSSTTSCPSRLLVPYVMYLIGKDNRELFPDLEAKGLDLFAKRMTPRKNSTRPPLTPYVYPVLRN